MRCGLGVGGVGVGVEDGEESGEGTKGAFVASFIMVGDFMPCFNFIYEFDV